MRSVAKHTPALFQRLEHELYVALLKISNAPMDEFGAAARCSFREIVGFEKQCFVTARGSLDRGSQTCSTATDDNYVPHLLRSDGSKSVFAGQGTRHCLVCLPALRTFERFSPSGAAGRSLARLESRGEPLVGLPLLCDRLSIRPVTHR